MAEMAEGMAMYILLFGSGLAHAMKYKGGQARTQGGFIKSQYSYITGLGLR